MNIRKLSGLALVALLLAGVAAMAEDNLALIISQQYGAERRDFSLGKNRAFVILDQTQR